VSEAGADATPAMLLDGGSPADSGLDDLPKATLDLGPSRADTMAMGLDLAQLDSSLAVDVSAQADQPNTPDIPMVRDGFDDLPAQQIDAPPMVVLDGPLVDTRPADSAQADLVSADLPADLPTDLPTPVDLPPPDLTPPTPDLPPPDLAPQPTIQWIVDNTTNIGGFSPTVLGEPTVSSTDVGAAVCFDGSKDALQIASNPLQGLQTFTLQTLVYPQFSGTDDPRVIYIGGTGVNAPRVVVQMRSDYSGAWHAYVTFFTGGTTTTIEDTSNNHPSNQWYWLAVTYDGQTARIYVNSVLENSSALTFDAMASASTSLGARQGGQYYFPGCMRAVEVFNRALPASQLQRL